MKNPPKPVYTKSPPKGSPGSMKSLILDDAEAPLGCVGMPEGKICPPKTNIFNLKITAFVVVVVVVSIMGVFSMLPSLALIYKG